MQIEIQLDEERARKLAYIQQQTQQDMTEVLQQAIDQYYQQIQPPAADPLAKLKESKFIGCFKGSPDLSTHSKTYFHNIMQEKFPQPPQDQ